MLTFSWLTFLKSIVLAVIGYFIGLFHGKSLNG